MVTTYAQVKALESKVIDTLSKSPNGMLTLQQLVERLEVHKAYLSGFLDGLVAAGKLKYIDIAGPVKVYAIADRTV